MASTIKLPEIFGLPPSGWVSDHIMKNAFPIIEFTPCIPGETRDNSINLFELNAAWGQYDTLLEKHGFTRFDSRSPMKLAMIADSFPTDTFTNEYNESMFEGMTNAASDGARQLTQMTGSDTASSALGHIMDAIPGGSALKKTGGKLVAGFDDALKKAFSGKKGGAQMYEQGKRLLDRTMAGARIDFPMLWQNSSFTPSYTFTVRLYNPQPDSEEMTNKYIVGPLAGILCLGLPRSDGETYNWPFFSKINVPGMWRLPAAAISNITVVKGGDQQQIAYNNRMGICDVRIDVISLYGSIVATEGSLSEGGRPTLKGYLDNMRGERTIEKRVHADPADIEGISYAASNPELIRNTHEVGTGYESINATLTPVNRVNDSDTNIYNQLVNSAP